MMGSFQSVRLSFALLSAVVLGWAVTAAAQEPAPAPRPVEEPTPLPAFVPPGIPCARPLPINLPTALRLADVDSLDIALASARIRIAAAQFDRAKVLWLPTILTGGDYFRHDGQLQNVEGRVFGTSKSTVMGGVGPSMVFAVTDAIFEPLATRQILRGREALLQAATNDIMLAVADAYFNMQQARGDLAGAEDTVQRAEEVVRRAEKLAPGLVPPLEVARSRTELARRRQAVHSARERWRVASAELIRIVRLDPGAVLEPVEPPFLEVSLVPPEQTVDELIAQGLTSRPELAAQQALVQATLRRLREEKLRPLVPSVLLRGAATNPAATLSSGIFAGGRNDFVGDTSARNTMDIQLLWELQNLGLGNRARIRERRAENEAALLELFRTQDRVAAEVAQAYAQVQSAAARIGDAKAGLSDAAQSATQNIEAMSQTKRPAGNIVLLVVRPQEAVAAVQALSQAYFDYFGAVADYNRAQFRLYRALGNPAQLLIAEDNHLLDNVPDCLPVAQP